MSGPTNIAVKGVEVSAANPVPVTGASSVTDSTGTPFDPDSMAQTLAYNSDGTIHTITATNGTNTWTQTFTYTAGVVTGISQWVKV